MTQTGTLTWRRLATRLGVFVAVVALLDQAVGLGLSVVLPRARAGLQVGVVNTALDAEADVVILGSSRAMRGFDDAALSRQLGLRVHNAGVDGRGVLFARGLLALVCERHAPKLVVVDLTYVDGERANARSLAPYYGRSQILDEILIGGDWRERVKLASRTFRMNGVAIAIVANLFRDGPTFGFDPLADRLDAGARLGDRPERPLAHPPRYVEENLAALVREARRCGAKIAFTESPTFGDPVAGDVRAMYERVAAEADVPFVRIAGAELPGFGPALFWDRGHLNADGAAVFTRAFGERLRPILEPGNGLQIQDLGN